MQKEQKRYVIGHKNPDTDSICAAVAYAHLKKELGVHVVPARAGKVNKETQFALDYFSVPAPDLVEDVYPRISDIEITSSPIIHEDDGLCELWQIMKQNAFKAVPVLNSAETLVGIVTVGDFAKHYFAGLDAKEAVKEIKIDKNITVKDVMEKNIVSFDVEELLSNVKATIDEKGYKTYPVVDDGALLGVLTAESLSTAQRVQLLLVDHNEMVQAVNGAETAQITDIIDHHRMGGIQTAEPLFAHIDRLGSTCTIVTQLYLQNKVEIPKQIAGLLLSAIISDTVLFKSPTCTEVDKKMAELLAEIAGVDLEKYGLELLKAGSDVGSLKDEEIVKYDMKEFTIDGKIILVSQISVMDDKAILARRDGLLATMQKSCTDGNYAMYLLMVTNILKEATTLLFVGEPQAVIMEAFHKDITDGCQVYLPGVLSRKKQIIPQVTEAVKKVCHG